MASYFDGGIVNANNPIAQQSGSGGGGCCGGERRVRRCDNGDRIRRRREKVRSFSINRNNGSHPYFLKFKV